MKPRHLSILLASLSLINAIRFMVHDNWDFAWPSLSVCIFSSLLAYFDWRRENPSLPKEEPKKPHPWGEFLNARVQAIKWMSNEQQKCDREIAILLSMDEVQVHLIRTAEERMEEHRIKMKLLGNS